jgi:flagellar basal body-associated protein FliL
LKAAREGAVDERRASHQKLIMLAVVFLITIIVAVIVSVLLVRKQSSNATEINQKVNIFNTAYETQYTTQIILAGGGLTGT